MRHFGVICLRVRSDAGGRNRLLKFLEVDITTGVIIGMAIVFFYAVLGGMKGITYTQVAQYCVLIFAFMVPAVFISILMTGIPIPQIGFGPN